MSQVYSKHDSFVEMAHTGQPAEVRGRLVRLLADLEARVPDPGRRAVVGAACAEALDETPVAPGETRFRLQSYVLDEIARLADEDLPRYLHYRYRYEMYPEQKRLDDFPPLLQIEPASICNYRCVFCYQTDGTFTDRVGGQMGLMTGDVFKRVVDQAEGRCEALSLASRGEPLINKCIDEMLAYLRGKFLAVKINTNAWYLDEAKCHALLQADINTLVFSADAASEPSYSQFRVNGRLDRVVENISRFAEIRAKQYPKARVITRVAGVKVPGTPGLDEMERAWGSLVDQVAFVSYNPWENTYARPVNDLTTPCSDLWRRMFVWWDGTANLCDVDYKSTLAVGCVQDASLAALWQSEGYMRLRQAHQDGRRGDCSPCQRCTVI